MKFTDSRRIGRDHRLVRQQVKLNQTLAGDKIESIERNLEALSQNKVMGAPIMKFSVDEIKNLEMKALDRLGADEKLAVDALCYTMTAIDGLLTESKVAAQSIRNLAGKGARNEERTAAAQAYRGLLVDALVNLRRLVEICQWYLDGDFRRITNTQFRRSDYEGPESIADASEPTKPIDEILPWGTLEENPELAKILSRFAGGIDEVAAVGTHVLHNWGATLRGRSDDAAPPLLLLRHFIETLDSIARLVEESAIEPCKALLRVALESYLYINYLIDEDFDKRTMAYMVWYAHHRTKYHLRHDPTTELGKQSQSNHQKDKVIGGFGEPPVYDSTAPVANLEQLLKKTAYIEAETEYQRIVANGSKNPKWYSLFDGPNSIEQLANEVGASGLYEVLYRDWSGAIHGTDLMAGKVTRSEAGEAEVVSIRHPENAQSVTSFAISLAVFLYREITEKYLPSDLPAFDAWYQFRVKPLHDKVSSDVPVIRLIDADSETD